MSRHLPHDPADPIAIRKRAMDLLASREHSFHQLLRKLTQKGFESDAVEVALDQLQQENLLSDERFAESFVRSRIRKGQGPQRIRMELERERIAGCWIEPAMEQDGFDWWAHMAEVYERKFRDQPCDDLKDKAKRFRFMTYRGFPSEWVRELLE